MIITVTMNPAIDKTVKLQHFQYGKLNRLQEVIVDAGGKGINVSKTIQALGGESIATGFLAETGKDVIEKYLSEHQIQQDFVSVTGTVRTNLKMVEEDGTLTELNEKGMKVSGQDIERLLKKVESYANPSAIFVLSGSIPEGVPTDIYAKMIQHIHKNGARAFVDADGELLKKALEEGPDYIKPNQAELCEYYGYTGEVSEQEIISFGKKLLNKGVTMAAVSRGEKGSLFLTEKECICQKGLNVKALSSVGAGDAMVAALCLAKERRLSLKQAAAFASAVSTGAVMTAGTKPPQGELVEELLLKMKASDR